MKGICESVLAQTASLTTRDWITVAQFCATVVMGWIGWSVRAIKKCVQKDISAMNERLVKAEQALETKASREDFIRANANTQRILEKLLEGMGELKGQVGAGTRIAAALERFADAREGKV